MNLLVIIPFENFIFKIVDIIKEVYSGDEKILYVTLSKPEKALIATLKERGLNTEQFIIVDCITKTVIKEPGFTKNCTYVSSPIAYDELNIAVESIVSTQRIGMVIFDSLSTLMIYEDESKVINFSKQFLEKLRGAKCEVILTFLKEDSIKDITQTLSSYVDKVISISD